MTTDTSNSSTEPHSRTIRVVGFDFGVHVIYGSALDVGAPANIFDAGSLAEEFPTFTAAVVRNRTVGPHESRADTAFEGGLTAMISGLRDQIGVQA